MYFGTQYSFTPFTEIIYIRYRISFSNRNFKLELDYLGRLIFKRSSFGLVAYPAEIKGTRVPPWLPCFVFMTSQRFRGERYYDILGSAFSLYTAASSISLTMSYRCGQPRSALSNKKERAQMCAFQRLFKSYDCTWNTREDNQTYIVGTHVKSVTTNRDHNFSDRENCQLISLG